jgi:molybdopterin adenylyltransferase
MSSSTTDSSAHGQSAEERSAQERSAQERSAQERPSEKESAPLTVTAAVVTVSDSCSRGERVDISGPAVAEALRNAGFRVVATRVVQDDSMQIQNALVHLALEARLIVTTGGTGIAMRDVTPEATEAICERLIDGVAERMRLEGARKTSFAALSRGVCGVRGKTLILNLPGSPSGAVESMQAVADLIPHALDLLAGKTKHS